MTLFLAVFQPVLCDTFMFNIKIIMTTMNYLFSWYPYCIHIKFMFVDIQYTKNNRGDKLFWTVSEPTGRFLEQ